MLDHVNAHDREGANLKDLCCAAKGSLVAFRRLKLGLSSRGLLGQQKVSCYSRCPLSLRRFLSAALFEWSKRIMVSASTAFGPGCPLTALKITRSSNRSKSTSSVRASQGNRE